MMQTDGEGKPVGGLSDRVRGILVGLYAGDRNGGPVRMALELAEYLLACGRTFRPRELLDRYVSWFVREGFDTGPVADRVFRRIACGVAPQEAVLLTHYELAMRTAGCNPAHRAAPLAMSAHLLDEELAELARQEAKLTHWDPVAGMVSAAVVVLCRALVRGEGWEESLRKAARHCDVLNRRLQSGGMEQPLDRSGFAPEALWAAVCFVHQSGDPGAALARSIEFAGRANYCPVLAGAIAGARWGASQIPQALLRTGPILPRVEQAADALSLTWRLASGRSP